MRLCGISEAALKGHVADLQRLVSVMKRKSSSPVQKDLRSDELVSVQPAP
jgi:hypothetical protein